MLLRQMRPCTSRDCLQRPSISKVPLVPRRVGGQTPALSGEFVVLGWQSQVVYCGITEQFPACLCAHGELETFQKFCGISP
ncbi:hypothetical protein KCV00_g104, partial [Aureobasidium melanogenum]